ncbi:ATP-binding protein [Halovivax gelatinilyticus]|uniref:ATP-binding protein n=1 Tax=Halovivax gelatinilyticus TaxID=2961597 RepID=UPI0020CA7892|nr:DUF87 domain-containing protein [Halovivax gelatinilyticus]
MAESIERFAVSEKGYSLPINEVLTGRGFVTGKSGSGKSNTASVVAEELLDRGLGLLIIDTDGEYSALKERYELLQVGGDEACDREITPEDAPLIADLALEENVPVILDVSGYMDEEVAQDVIHAVVRELFVAEKQYQKPFLLFVEEAHEFIPERGGGDDVHKMLVRVAKRGRKRGLGIVAMSQRPAAVAKDYITQCDWLVWHRLTWENDTKVAGRILGGDAAESVQSLDDGEALVMTDWDEKISRIQFRRKKTIDRGSTPTLRDAYGPPSSREDHVTQPVEEDDSDADAADDGDAEREGEPIDGEAEPVDSGEPPAAGESESPPQRQPSNWDLDDVDIEPRQPSLEAVDQDRSNRSDSTLEPEGGGATSESAEDRTTRSTGADIDRADASGETPTRDSTRRRLDEPDEYDPLWEVAQLIVYTYGLTVDVHRRVYGRLRGAYTGVCVWLRRSAIGSYRHGGPGRVESAVGSFLSVSTILVAYLLLILTIGLFLPMWVA